jgi:hypothetical protein
MDRMKWKVERHHTCKDLVYTPLIDVVQNHQASITTGTISIWTLAKIRQNAGEAELTGTCQSNTTHHIGLCQVTESIYLQVPSTSHSIGAHGRLWLTLLRQRLR